LAIYDATKAFPDAERFGLTSQLRRGGVSVVSNIAEGYGRQSTPDYVRFLRIARGALYEIETQLLFAKELGYLNETKSVNLQSLTDECLRMLAGLLRSLDRS